MGTSSANSAAIHAGYDAIPHKQGIHQCPGLEDVAANVQRTGIPYLQSGDYVVAVNDEEMDTLKELLERGRENGVEGLEIIDGVEMRRREPLIRPDVIGALWASTGRKMGDPFH